MTIGAAADPEEGKFNCSRHTLPLRRRSVSPGMNFEEPTFAKVFQGDKEEFPGLASFPFVAST